MSTFFTQGRHLGFPRLTHFACYKSAPSPMRTPPHFHFGYEFIYVEKGNAQAILADGAATVAVRARDLVVFAPRYEHQFTRQAQNAHYWLGIQTGERVVEVEGGSAGAVP